MPQRDVEALRAGLGDRLPLADLQVGDLGVKVVEHAGVLAHRALGLPGGAGGEGDVASWSGRDVDPEVLLGVVLRVGRVDEQRLDSGQRVEGLVERGGAAAFGQHEPALGTGERRRDAIGREMRLDGQVHAAGLEDRKDGGHPVQIALGHHRHDTFAAQPPRQQGSPSRLARALSSR